MVITVPVSIFHAIIYRYLLFAECIGPGKKRNNLIGEDSRIFNHNGQLWLVYNTHLTEYKQLYYTPVQHRESDNSMIVVQEPLHVTYEGEVNVRHQKNWVPFDFCPQCMWTDQGYVDATRHAMQQPSSHPANLFFVYSVQPHRIVQTYPSNRSDEVDARTVRDYGCNYSSSLACIHAVHATITETFMMPK